MTDVAAADNTEKQEGIALSNVEFTDEEKKFWNSWPRRVESIRDG